MKLVTVTFLLLALSPLVSVASPVGYEEGVHYFELTVPVRSRDPDKIEVTEYFSYGCPHCYDLDESVAAWSGQLGADVTFNRTPAMWSKEYEIYARTYYAAEALGVQEVMHTAIFSAIHMEKRSLASPQAMAMFFSELGINPADFAKVYQSFGVRASVQQAEARGRSYRASGVPCFIVNGKYRVDTSENVGKLEMLRVVNFLIDKERAARSASAS